MVNINALGIIFPNTYDELVPQLVKHRTMASVPFGGRYRMIDFTLSGMVNAGIENVTVIAKKNYHSLMDHLGSGREWDLVRKRGGLNIVPPYAQSQSKVYHGRVEALYSIVNFLAEQKEKYVVISDCNVASDLNFAHLIDAHVKSGANVTMVYERAEIAKPITTDNYTFTMDDAGRVTEIRWNDYRMGVQNLSMGVIVMDREELIAMVKDAAVQNRMYLERDILGPSLKILHVQGYEYSGYRARIYDIKSYFDENMRLLCPENVAQLFPTECPVYTKVRDEAPVRYAMDCQVHRCIVADGCIIEGEVENCVLFRGVKVSKGAKVKNCVLMQGTTVEPGVTLDYIVTDKNVTITADDGEVKQYQVPYSVGLKVEHGKRVRKGEPITDGALNPHDVLRISGVEAVQDYLTQGVLAVYRQQGVDINEKHIEVIIRQMMRKVKVEEPGDTNLLSGTVVDIFEFEDANAAVQARIDAGETDLKPATDSLILMGITKASLATESWLSAASFQETTKVLTDAAIKGKVDHLIGLKENVIIGKLIPAGSGLKAYRDFDTLTTPESIVTEEMIDDEKL
mgnify:CR=1 FL=1